MGLFVQCSTLVRQIPLLVSVEWVIAKLRLVRGVGSRMAWPNSAQGIGTWRWDICVNVLKLLNDGTFRLATVMHVVTSASHLSQDCWTLSDVAFAIDQAIAEVLHSTYTIENIVRSLVNTTTHHLTHHVLLLGRNLMSRWIIGCLRSALSLLSVLSTSWLLKRIANSARVFIDLGRVEIHLSIALWGIDTLFIHKLCLTGCNIIAEVFTSATSCVYSSSIAVSIFISNRVTPIHWDWLIDFFRIWSWGI